MVVVSSDVEDVGVVDGQLWRASVRWLCSAEQEHSWSRQKYFPSESGNVKICGDGFVQPMFLNY
jgi:hypothetical protein